MKKAILFIMAISLICTTTSYAVASEMVWHDSEKGAIAIDPYADGFGGFIHVDFNADHTYAGIIDQSGWHYLYGSETTLGVYKYEKFSWGSGSTYGWGDKLGSFSPAYDFATFVTSLYTGEPTVDGFFFSTPEWDVSKNKTVIYVQPVENSKVISVRSDDLDNIYLRVNSHEWVGFNDYIFPEPVLDPVHVTMTMSPHAINAKSEGNWVTAQITLPNEYSPDSLDLETVYLSVSAMVAVNNSPTEKVTLTSKASTTGKGSNKLVAKFSRESLLSLLPSGDSTVSIQGRFFDGTPISGETNLRIIH